MGLNNIPNGTWSLPPQTNLPPIPIKVVPGAFPPFLSSSSGIIVTEGSCHDSAPISFTYGYEPAVSEFPYLHQITPRACYLCLKGTEFEFVSSTNNRIPVCNRCLETEFNYVKLGDDFVKGGEGGLILPVK